MVNSCRVDIASNGIYAIGRGKELVSYKTEV